MPRYINLANVQQFTAVQLTSDPGYIGGPEVIQGVARIYLHWALGDGKAALNVLHGRYTGTFAGTPTQATAMLTALTSGTQWTALASFLAPTMALNQVWIQDVGVAQQPIIVSTTGGSNGTSTGTELPNEVALVITLRTGGIGRENRGRMFIPGWATTSLATGNVVAAAAVTALQNWAGNISGILSAQGYQWGIGHRARAAYTGITGTEHPAREAGLVPIQTVLVRDNHWDSQRRRGLR
jgi:hypothetical protein